MGRLHKGLGGHAGCVMQTPNESYNNLSLTFHSSINPWCKISSYDSMPNSMPGFVGDTDALGLLDMGVCRVFSIRFQIGGVSLLFRLQEIILSLGLWSSFLDISKSRMLYLPWTGTTVNVSNSRLHPSCVG